MNRSVRNILHGVRSAMASVRLQPVSPFNFKTPDEWPRWKWRFEQFRLVSGLAGESDDRQVSTLLYCIGKEAEDILASTNIAEADRQKYSAVIKQYDDYQVRKNVIFPPFHTGTRPGLYPSFGIDTGTLTRVLDPACEQGFDPGLRPAYVITVS